jgi:tetratricopeptide (TPR) repeat protein
VFVFAVLLSASALSQPTVQPPGAVPPSPLAVGPAPALPHELHPDAWPQPDYFQEALKLTSRVPGERFAEPRLRLAATRGRPEYVVLPVQTQAFGFSPAFRAQVAAELDVLLDRHALSVSRQTDIVDTYGPTVRRLPSPAVDELQRSSGSKLIGLYLGHDGADTAFLTLSVQDAKGRRVAHRSFALADDADQAARTVVQRLPEVLRELKLGSEPAAALPAGRAGCEASAWQLADGERQDGALERACAALVVGTLMPDFDFSGMPGATQSTDSRLAWLARARAWAAQVQPPSEASQAIVHLARAQIDTSFKLPPGVAALSGTDDPVISRVARLVALAQLRSAPVQSPREAMRRQAERVADGLPPLAAAAVRALAEFADSFGEVDPCEFERAYPGGMLSPSCRQLLGTQARPPARAATRPEALVFQEWRLASWYHDVNKQASALGNIDRARAFTSGLPRDVAAHPFMRRLLVAAGLREKPTGNYDDLLRNTRQTMGDIVETMVDLQRNDSWVAGYSLTEHGFVKNSNITADPQVMEWRDDDARLLGVLKYDRFVGPFEKPFRRKPGEGAFFLRPDRSMLNFEFSLARMFGLAVAAPPASGPARPYVPPPPAPLFGTPWSNGPRRGPEEMAASLASRPDDLSLRVELAFARLRRGVPMDEAAALIAAQPENNRPDARIGLSHDWADPAHGFFFAGETEAALKAYDKVDQIGTGSSSHLQAIARSAQLRGRFDEALVAHQRRIRRYESDYALRDVATMLFMKGQSRAAWDLLLPRAPMTGTFQLWIGMMAGHRIEGLDAAGAGQWLQAQGLSKVQIGYVDVATLYPHLLAVVDRVPSAADVSLLSRPAAGQLYVARHWALSALLQRTAMLGGDEESVRQQVRAAVKEDRAERLRFMLPAYAWVAWRATQGKDDVLQAVRGYDFDADFEGLLAKAIVLGLDGRTEESVRYFTAARFDLVGFGRSQPIFEQPIPVAYQLALAGQMLYQHTGYEAYRRETLRLAKAYQLVFPSMAWAYALEALLEKDPRRRQVAGCRAQFLDPKSHFLQRAAVPGLTAVVCKPTLW